MPWTWTPPDDDPYDVRLAFGRGIRALRLYHGFTQRELGERSGLDQSNISRLETGRPISIRFSRVLGVLDAMWVNRTVFKTRREGSTYLAFLTRGDPDAIGPEPPPYLLRDHEPPRDPWWPSEAEDTDEQHDNEEGDPTAV
jgi:transcriptional regulator with XRE-family HTH domain